MLIAKEQTKMIKRVEDCLIDTEEETQIISLLRESFPLYPAKQSFLNQRPNFRYLTYDQNLLVGHLGVESRIISIDDTPFKIFGIVDLCVKKDFQERKIASNLVKELIQFGESCKIDFILLFSSEKKFYKKLGFEEVQNKSRWLMIQKLKTLGVARRNVSDSLMVRKMGEKEWMKGEVDLLGHIF